jgi:TetR/AcrR family transcriptional regulator, transcriptional repressor of aconitase
MRRTNENLDRERRKQILDAALQCFLQFGYSKTSMDDVAKKANLSRPLIYLKFKSKQDLFLGLYVDFTEEALTQAATVLKSKRSTKEILLEVTEIVTIRAWEKVAGHPMAAEFYPICQQQFPKESERIERDVVKIYQEIFEGDKGKAEVFLLAVDGLHTDTPTSKVLRKRLEILIDQFA